MDINTSVVHQRNNRVVLSQRQVEEILAEAVCVKLDRAIPFNQFTFFWQEESFDSGLRKRPQIVVSVIEDLSA